MDRNRTLAKLAFAMLVLLIGQYVLGMYTNLFVQIPDGVDGWKWMSNSLAIMGHVTLGTGLLVVAGALLALSARARSRAWVAASLAGIAGIAASLFGGSTFMNGQADTMSFLMACGLAVAMLAYATGLYAWAIGTNAQPSAAA